MKKYFFVVFFCLSALTYVSGQSKRANVWYVSEGVGLDFNCTPPCPLRNGAMGKCFSSSGICDKNGNLQFYTDNETIWNSSHQVMENGTDLYACKWADQGSVIVPLTSNPNQYYLVTCDNFRFPLNVYTPDYICSEIYPVKKILSLHLIDMGYNNGRGAVLWKNKIIYSGQVTSMLAAVKHANTKDTWLLTYDYDTDHFISLLLTDCGIQDTVVSPNLGFNHSGTSPVKFSPKGDLFHVATQFNEQGSMIARFNTTTGEASDPVFLRARTTTACFSTDSRYLYTNAIYASETDKRPIIPRYDLWLTDTAAMYTNRQSADATIYEGNNFGIQNGPDQSMYYCYNQSYITWYIIPDPLADSFTYRKQYDPVTKPRNIIQSAIPPNFVQSWFDPDFKEYEYGSPTITYERVCTGNKTILKAAHIPPATGYHWEIQEDNKPVAYYYNQDSIAHLFTTAGKHTAKLIIDFSCMPDIITRSDIFTDKLPSADYIKDTLLCSGNTVVLQAEPDQSAYLWNTGSTASQETGVAGQVYTVSVSNSCGTATDSVSIRKVFYRLYNLITPNNDGLNETFVIDSDSPIYGHLEIYDAWGSRVYSNAAYNNTWPEKHIDAGIYYYQFTYSTCKPDKGWLQVIK